MIRMPQGSPEPSNMDNEIEVYDKSEAFVEKDGDLEFSHTKVILRQGDRFFYCISKHRLPDFNVDCLPSELHEIPLNKVWPLVNSNLTEAPSPLPANCYIKKPRLIEYGDTEATLDPGSQLLHEAEIWNFLKDSPHPNIAQFLGCIIKGQRLTGLCFLEYSMDLHKAAKISNSLDMEKCLLGIEDGIRHLHGLGLIHNDLNPSNIMMDGDIPVIIDMDSCQLEGAKLGVKGGTVGWISCDTAYAERKNDLEALSKIRSYLKDVCGQHQPQ